MVSKFFAYDQQGELSTNSFNPSSEPKSQHEWERLIAHDGLSTYLAHRFASRIVNDTRAFRELKDMILFEFDEDSENIKRVSNFSICADDTVSLTLIQDPYRKDLGRINVKVHFEDTLNRDFFDNLDICLYKYWEIAVEKYHSKTIVLSSNEQDTSKRSFVERLTNIFWRTMCSYSGTCYCATFATEQEYSFSVTRIAARRYGFDLSMNLLTKADEKADSIGFISKYLIDQLMPVFKQNADMMISQNRNEAFSYTQEVFSDFLKHPISHLIENMTIETPSNCCYGENNQLSLTGKLETGFNRNNHGATIRTCIEVKANLWCRTEGLSPDPETMLDTLDNYSININAFGDRNNCPEFSEIGKEMAYYVSNRLHTFIPDIIPTEIDYENVKIKIAFQKADTANVSMILRFLKPLK